MRVEAILLDRYKTPPVSPRPECAARRCTLTSTEPSLEDPAAPEPFAVSPTGLDPSCLDEDAVRSVARLQSHGYEAYLVGGCVRDLLLGQRPKDFDIATSARPAGVKRTFPRNCRIIGRRFKLAHLHFQGNSKILEVSTFRRAPEQPSAEDLEDADLLITRDNEFGTAEEDALRRDFTINALFYDPTRDELVDHVGGLRDLEARLVRTIGDPLVRFREDPVRILRAIKFTGRLGLRIEEETAAAMQTVAPDLVRAAPPRLLEEFLRLLRGGHALDAFQRMRDCGALRAVLPQVQSYLDAADRDERVRFWRLLEALDGLAAIAGRNTSVPWPADNGVLLACLFHRPVQVAAAASPDRSPTSIAEELISPFANDFRLPRRDAGCLKRICAVQHRFLSSDRRRIENFSRDPYFQEAVQLFHLVATAEGLSTAALDGLTPRGHRTDAPAARHREADVAEAAERTDEGRRERRRKKKRSGGRDEQPASVEAAKPSSKKHRREGSRDEGRRERKKKRSGGGALPERARDFGPRKIRDIEPETIDLSAFDVELDPRRVPTFGTIVEGEDSKKKNKRRAPTSAEDDYRPPPPPGSGGGDFAPPPPPSSAPTNDTFGDW